MREPNDWRLNHQESDLKGVTLTWRSYRPVDPTNDHDHCEFCWAKFMNADVPGTLREGWSTADGYSWVCEKCFDDFFDLFGWQAYRGG